MKIYSLEDETSTSACNNMNKSQTIMSKSSQTPFIEGTKKRIRIYVRIRDGDILGGGIVTARKY